MKIELVGTGSIGAKQLSASTLINDEILVDVPNGIIKRLKQTGHDILKIKVILITHLHGDHFLDIPFFMLEKYFYKAENETKIYCPVGTKLKIKQLFEIAFPGDYDNVNKYANVEFIEFEELNKENILDDTYVDSKVVDHGSMKPAYGYIIHVDDKILGFSGDSKLCKVIEEIVEESNLAVLDMSCVDNINESHMRFSEVEELCQKYKDKTIVATHMHDYTREKAKGTNFKNLIIPDDGQKIEI